MISPTIGRVVWFRARQHHKSQLALHSDQPCAAIVCYVWNDRMVNVDVIDHRGTHHSITSVPLLQGDEDESLVHGGSTCEWMPFQKGQAAKVDAVLAKARDVSTQAEAGTAAIGTAGVVNAMWQNAHGQAGEGSAP